jgi:hypothetical protein
MEKLTIRSTYTQVDLYARLSLQGPGKAQGAGARLQADDGAAPGKAPAVPDARNADGDTFTLSVEARAVQVTESITIETEGPAGPAGDAACLPSGPSEPSPAPDLPHGHGRRHHGYPRLADPEDVAARIAEAWDQEHKARGGSRQAFAAAARARLAHWKAGDHGAPRMQVEHEEFRSEVAIRIEARLEQWANAGEPEAGASVPAASSILAGSPAQAFAPADPAVRTVPGPLQASAPAAAPDPEPASAAPGPGSEPGETA